MAGETLDQEVARLRAAVEVYRQKELHDLRMAVDAALKERDAAQHAADHFRAEAQRNAELGRQIASEYQQQLVELRSKIEIMNQSHANVRRFGERGD